MKLLDVVTSPWAIMPDKLTEIQDIYGRHLKGEKIDIAGIEARLGQPLQRREQGFDVIDNVAIIPVDGIIAKRMNLFSQISGGASTELIERDIRDALNDNDIAAIILDIDSPGGTVDGTSTLARLIFESRDQKPIVAWANGLMASAAYWAGSAAHQVYNSCDTTTVGSIGVLTRHVDYSEHNKKLGINPTEIYSGKYKVVGSENKPLSNEDRAIIQAELDYLYTIFVQTVARHRGVDVQVVLDDMADGRTFTGQQAIDAGLVDGVATLEQLVAALSGGTLPDPASLSAGALSGEDLRKMVAALETDLDKSANADSTQETEMTDTTQENTAAEGDACKMPDGTAGTIQNGECVPTDSGSQQPPAAAEGDACTMPDGSEGIIQNGQCVPDTNAPANADESAAAAERHRIQAVLALAVPGHEQLVNQLAFDGHTTAPEAAIKILQAQKEQQATIADRLHADGSALAAIPASTEANVIRPESDAVAGGLIEEQARAEWDKDKDLHAEFGKFETYLAFKQLEAKNPAKKKSAA